MKPRSEPGSPQAPTATTTSSSPNEFGGNRACLALARKLLKRSYHILKALGDDALKPAAT